MYCPIFPDDPTLYYYCDVDPKIYDKLPEGAGFMCEEVMFIDMKRNLHIYAVPAVLRDLDVNTFFQMNTFKGTRFGLLHDAIGVCIFERGPGLNNTPYEEKETEEEKEKQFVTSIFHTNKNYETYSIDQFEKEAREVFTKNKIPGKKTAVVVYITGNSEQEFKAAMAVVNVCREMEIRLVFMYRDKESNTYKAYPIQPFYKY